MSHHQAAQALREGIAQNHTLLRQCQTQDKAITNEDAADYGMLCRLERHQRVPVLNQHFGAVEFLPRRLGWTKLETVVIIFRVAGH